MNSIDTRTVGHLASAERAIARAESLTGDDRRAALDNAQADVSQALGWVGQCAPQREAHAMRLYRTIKSMR